MDPRLEGFFGVEQMRDLANIAAQCLAESSGNRPDMRQVVTLLGGIATMHCLDDAHHFIASENLDGGSDVRSTLTGLSVSWSDSV